MNKVFELSIETFTSCDNKIPHDLFIYWGNTTHFLKELPKMYNYLSEVEKNRADKFKCNVARESYIISHYMLRKKIADSLGIPSYEVYFKYEAMRKPSIPEFDIDFNLSHSKNYFCFGIAKKKCSQIGVDIEKIEYLRDMNDIVNNYFHPEEKKYIKERTLTNTEKLIRFYEIWTRKEAFLKMIGIGIVTDLRKINLSPKSRILSIEGTLEFPDCNGKVSIYTWITNEFVLSISSNLKGIPKLSELNNI